MPQNNDSKTNMNSMSRYNRLQPGDLLNGVKFLSWKTEEHNYKGIAIFECSHEGCHNTFEAKPGDVASGWKSCCKEHTKCHTYSVGDKIGPHQLELVERIDGTYGIFRCNIGCEECPYEYLLKKNIHSVRIGRTYGCNLMRAKNSAKGHQKTFIPRDITGQKFGHLTAIRPLDDKMNSYTMWEFSCDCGRDDHVRMTYNTLMTGRRKHQCPQCSRDEARNTYEDISGQRFGHLTAQYRFIRDDGEARWHCLCDCGRTTDTTLSKLKTGWTRSCGKCNTSRGEDQIENALKELGVRYSRQESFKDIDEYPICYSPQTNHILYFDFYLPDYHMCLEFDGPQHFQKVRKFRQTEEELSVIQYRDAIKNKWCHDNGIILIRLTYRVQFKIDAEYINSIINREYDGTDVAYIVADSDPTMEEGDSLIPIVIDDDITFERVVTSSRKHRYNIGDKIGKYGFELLKRGRTYRDKATFKCNGGCEGCDGIIDRTIAVVLKNSVPKCFYEHNGYTATFPECTDDVKTKGTRDEWFNRNKTNGDLTDTNQDSQA